MKDIIVITSYATLAKVGFPVPPRLWISLTELFQPPMTKTGCFNGGGLQKMAPKFIYAFLTNAKVSFSVKHEIQKRQKMHIVQDKAFLGALPG